VPTRSAKRKHRTRARATVSNNGAAKYLRVRKSSVHGQGVYTTRPIRKRAFIIEYTGRRILWSSVPEESDDLRTYYFGLDDGKRVIDPTVGGNEARWINHSCDPNCEAIEDDRGRVFIEALRNIRTGEELFYDYRFTIDVPRTKEIERESICHCGSPNCRGNMLDLTSDL
jgi:SET domain-containing protein